MLADGWLQQRRNVQRLSRFVHLKTAEERQLRHAIRTRSREMLSSKETLLVAGATGAVWTMRMLSNEHDEREHPFATLLGSALRIHRWRFLAHRVAARLSGP